MIVEATVVVGAFDDADDELLVAAAAALRIDDVLSVSAPEEFNEAMQRLIDAGYLVRVPFADREKFAVAITDQGKARVEHLLESRGLKVSVGETPDESLP